MCPHRSSPRRPRLACGCSAGRARILSLSDGPPDPPDCEGQQAIELRPVNSLGRHPNNTIQLLDKIVSKEHCIIELRGDHFVLRDLGSLNGTFVNNERVRGEARSSTATRSRSARPAAASKTRASAPTAAAPQSPDAARPAAPRRSTAPLPAVAQPRQLAALPVPGAPGPQVTAASSRRRARLPAGPQPSLRSVRRRAASDAAGLVAGVGPARRARPARWHSASRPVRVRGPGGTGPIAAGPAVDDPRLKRAPSARRSPRPRRGFFPTTSSREHLPAAGGLRAPAPLARAVARDRDGARPQKSAQQDLAHDLQIRPRGSRSDLPAGRFG
jgi:hypothetical protein